MFEVRCCPRAPATRRSARTARICRIQHSLGSHRFDRRSAGGPERTQEAVFESRRVWQKTCSLTRDFWLHYLAAATLTTKGQLRRYPTKVHLGEPAELSCPKLFIFSASAACRYSARSEERRVGKECRTR